MKNNNERIVGAKNHFPANCIDDYDHKFKLSIYLYTHIFNHSLSPVLGLGDLEAFCDAITSHSTLFLRNHPHPTLFFYCTWKCLKQTLTKALTSYFKILS